MGEKHEVRICGKRNSALPAREFVRERTKEFDPDVTYVNGWAAGSWVKENMVYDMGSFISRNILIKERGMNIDEMLKTDDRELVSILRYSRMTDYYEKEKTALENAKAIINWEGKESELIKKIFGKEIRSKVKEISMMFAELPEPIPFEKKKDKIISIASKWGDREKDFGILNKAKLDISIETVGHGGDIRSLRHDLLMDKLNESKVLFCPFKAGGCGVVSEALRLGCNVVVMEWFPFDTYINDELFAKRKNIVETLRKALEKYYPPKKELPTEERQLGRIMDVCYNIKNEKESRSL